MAHYAKIENDIVVNVIVAEEDFIQTLEGEWIQTSYNTYLNQHILGGTPLRKNFAAIGYQYNRELDAFIAPKQFNSYILNEEVGAWESPIPYPTDGKSYQWDEELLNWIEIEQ